jgi:hypothetical protein
VPLLVSAVFLNPYASTPSCLFSTTDQGIPPASPLSLASSSSTGGGLPPSTALCVVESFASWSYVCTFLLSTGLGAPASSTSSNVTDQGAAPVRCSSCTSPTTYICTSSAVFCSSSAILDCRIVKTPLFLGAWSSIEGGRAIALWCVG